MMRDVGVQMDSGQRRGASVGDTRRKIPTFQSKRARAHEPPSPPHRPLAFEKGGKKVQRFGNGGPGWCRKARRQHRHKQRMTSLQTC